MKLENWLSERRVASDLGSLSAREAWAVGIPRFWAELATTDLRKVLYAPSVAGTGRE